MKMVNKMISAILIMSVFLSVSFTDGTFSKIDVAAIGNTYYVDYTNGSNNNDGLTTSTAWKTLGVVSGITFYPGDTIKLKCGEVWNENIQLWGQGTATNPITLTSYGTGNKPKIRSNAYSVVSGTNVSGWKIKGLAIECTTTELVTGSNRNTGIQFSYDKEGQWSDITIEENEVFGGGIDKNVDGIRISSSAPYNRVPAILINVNIQDNVVHDLGLAGISSIPWNTVDGVTMRSVGQYENVKVFRNTVYNTGSQGIMMTSIRNAAMKWNLVHDCGKYTGTGITWGSAGLWCMLSSRVDIMFNEIYNQSDSNNGNDAGGIDIDWTCEYVNVTNNYIYNNKGPGIETMSNRNCTIASNKISGNTCLTGVGTGQISISAFTDDSTGLTGINNLQILNNLIFVNRTNTYALSTITSSAGPWSSNNFSNNNIILSGVAGSMNYNLATDTIISTANNNNAYSSGGSTWEGKKNGITYSTLSSWRSGSGLDANSVTGVNETTAPTAVSGVSVSGSTVPFGMNLTWIAATDSGRGISHYNIHRSISSSFTPSYQNMVGESSSTSYFDTQEVGGSTTYYYKVTAEDKCGNIGIEGTGNSTSGTQPSSSISYQASKGFSTLSHRPNWSYMNWDGSKYNLISTYDNTVLAWKYLSTNLVLYPDAQVPDSYDSVRRWIAPFSGNITISANGSISNIQSGGDGVNVKVVKNSSKIWPAGSWQLVTYNNPVSFPSTSTSVVEGDAIYFIVNKNSIAAYDFTIWDPIITYTSVSNQNTYQASTGFSTEIQGIRWYNRYWIGTEYCYMNVYDAAWYSWRQSSTYCQVGSNFQHPDVSKDSVREFICPRTGTITISSNGNISVRDQLTGQDGVLVKVMQNGTQIWPTNGWQGVNFGTPITFPSTNLYVNANDSIYFIVNPNGNIYADTTLWDPVITYN